MTEQESRFAEWLRVARDGSPEALGQVLEACRGYLLLIAREELDADLRAKGSASDLVQETFVEAQRDFAHFHGEGEGELLAWLRAMLLNNLRDFTRRYQPTGKRGVDREISLDAVGATPGLEFFFVSDSSSPSEQVLRSEKAEIVHRALALARLLSQRALAPLSGGPVVRRDRRAHEPLGQRGPQALAVRDRTHGTGVDAHRAALMRSRSLVVTHREVCLAFAMFPSLAAARARATRFSMSRDSGTL